MLSCHDSNCLFNPQGSFPRHLPFSEGMIKVYKEVKCFLCCLTSIYVKNVDMDMSWSNSGPDRLVTPSAFTVYSCTRTWPS